MTTVSSERSMSFETENIFLNPNWMVGQKNQIVTLGDVFYLGQDQCHRTRVKKSSFGHLRIMRPEL